MAKYVINENSDLHSLAQEVEKIAKRREKTPVPDEITAKATAATSSGKARPAPAHRMLLLGIGLGAAAVIVAMGVFFGIGRLFTPGMRTVPDVMNKRIDIARSTLEAGGFRVVVEYDNSGDKPTGTVIAQVPPARMKKPAGSQVIMRVAGNPPGRGKQATVKTGAFELGQPAPEAAENAKTTPSEQPVKEAKEGGAKETAPTETVATKLTVPAVVGMNIEEARKLLQDMGLKIVEAGAREADKPEGTVVEIDPKAGVEIQAGALVRIRINTLLDKKAAPESKEPEAAPEASRIILRDYTGRPGDEAASDLYSRGLSPEWRYEISTSYIPGTVIVTDPPAGSRIPPGSKVFMVLAQ